MSELRFAKKNTSIELLGVLQLPEKNYLFQMHSLFGYGGSLRFEFQEPER